MKDDDDIQEYVRPWVGLTEEEKQWIYVKGRTYEEMIKLVEARLKEKNT
jgi:hypothetical protein